jgi:hypothetical protein
VFRPDEAAGAPENYTLQMAYEAQGLLVVPATNIQAAGTQQHGPRRKYFDKLMLTLLATHLTACPSMGCRWSCAVLIATICKPVLMAFARVCCQHATLFKA